MTEEEFRLKVAYLERQNEILKDRLDMLMRAKDYAIKTVGKLKDALVPFPCDCADRCEIFGTEDEPWLDECEYHRAKIILKEVTDG